MKNLVSKDGWRREFRSDYSLDGFVDGVPLVSLESFCQVIQSDNFTVESLGPSEPILSKQVNKLQSLIMRHDLADLTLPAGL